MGIRLKGNNTEDNSATKSIITDSTVINKNSGKKAGVFAAILLILLASVGFVSLYPLFRTKADSYKTSFNEDVMENEGFLRDLYKGNTILYKELQEQVNGHPLRYQDIYLSITEEPAHVDSTYIDFDGESAGEYAGRKLYEMLKVWEDNFWDKLDYTIDYQIVDHASGTKITNTGNDIEQLGTKEAADELLSQYPYYIKMQYDDAGFLEHVWVKGIDADSLLRSVQRVMRSNYLERSFYDFYCNDGYLADLISSGEIYYFQGDNMMKARINVNNTPRNCTISYALTQKQRNYLSETNAYHQNIDSWSAYYYMVADAFRLFLLVLGILALLMPLSKKYHLHELWFFHFHLEILLMILFLMFCWMGDLETRLVLFTIDGNSANPPAIIAMIQSLLPDLSMKSMEMISVAMNILVLFCMFGFWYIMVTGLGEVYTIGIRRYIKKRSICYRIYHRIRIFCSRKATQLKEEILHVDLDRNMNKTLLKIVVVNYLLLAFLSMLWFAGIFILLLYSVILYMALKKYIRHIQVQYKHLLAATQSIADGNLQTEFTGDWGVFESYKSQLAQIQLGFSKAVEEEVKSQRMRTELITNVSHDLKTPLTAITTYIELLQEEGVTKEQRREYLDVLARKAQRLKTLIEDLFEVSKASSGNVSLQLDRVDIGNLMRQAYLEYEDKVKEADLIFRFRMPEEKQFVLLDSQKTYRIFENLYTNIIKYAMPHTRVYVNIDRLDDDVVIELKNMSRAELNIAAESLTERFVRGDSSRNTEGSGLGLAIARNFVELQNGKMQLAIDGDLFKVTIVWKGL